MIKCMKLSQKDNGHVKRMDRKRRALELQSIRDTPRG